MLFACIFIPDFAVQAVIRQELELGTQPVIVLQGAPPLTKVFGVNQAARERGVEIGMTKLQAEACGPISWRWRSRAQEASAQAALLDCAYTVSPRMELGTKAGEGDFSDSVILDIDGCEKLFGPTEAIAHRLQQTVAKVSLPSNVAVAVNPQAAAAGARGFGGITVIPPGKEAACLGPLPLSTLGMPAEFLETLDRWGIHSYADFAALPEISVIERFGQEGKRWLQLSQGNACQPFLPKAFTAEFEEAMDLEFPVDLLEPLLFVLNRLLEQVCARLRMHLLATGELKITLKLQPCNTAKEPPVHIRNLRLPVPVSESKFLLKLLQLDLQAHPPGSPVTMVTVQAIPTRSRTRQLGLFLPLAPEREALEIALARIQRTVGEGRAGSPVLLDSHRPNAFEQKRFVLQEASLNNLPAEQPPKAALRVFRPPLPATVQLKNENQHPASIYFQNVRKPILAFAGPSRSSGDWWTENPWARDEWDVLVPLGHTKYHPDKPFLDLVAKENGAALYRIYQDLISGHWFVEGIYD